MARTGQSPPPWTPTARAAKDEVSGRKRINQYNLLAEAGRGAFGKVKWAEDAEGKPYAIKVFYRGILERQVVPRWDKDGVTTISLRSRIAQELDLLGALRQCSHIVELQEVIDDPSHEKLYVVLEGLPGGQLMNWDEGIGAYRARGARNTTELVREHWGDGVSTLENVLLPTASGDDVLEAYCEPVAARLMANMLSAVEYMHSRGVIHKDLKPDNVMLTLPLPVCDARFVRHLCIGQWPAVGKNGSATDGLPEVAAQALDRLVAKVGDFNSAAECEQPELLIYDAEGTQLFTPPECFESRDCGLPGRPRDMWSLGCILFCMLFGRTPYWAEQNIVLQLAIMQDDLVIPKDIVSPAAEDMIRSLMSREPRARSSASAALAHSWLQKAPRSSDPAAAPGSPVVAAGVAVAETKCVAVPALADTVQRGTGESPASPCTP